MSNRLVLLSDLSLVTSRGVVSLYLEQELDANALAAAIRKASSEGRLVAVLGAEDKRMTLLIVGLLILAEVTCDFKFDLRSLATDDEVIAATPRGDGFCWGRYHVTVVVPPEPDACHRAPPFSGRHTEGESAPNEDFGAAASEGTPGDTESPD